MLSIPRDSLKVGARPRGCKVYGGTSTTRRHRLPETGPGLPSGCSTPDLTRRKDQDYDAFVSIIK